MLGPNLVVLPESVPISLAKTRDSGHTHCMTAQARYLVLSLYEIPAIQITTSCGSRASGFPFDKIRLVAGSRRFFAYSRAAHEAPSFSSGSSWTVSLGGWAGSEVEFVAGKR